MAKKSGGGVFIGGLGFGIAAGVALGTLVIAPNLPEGSHAQLAIAQKDLAESKELAEINGAQAASADGLIGDLAASVVKDTLKDKTVLIMHTEDADATDLSRVSELLGKAGAEITGDIALKDKFLSKDGADSLKSIVANTLPAGAKLSTDSLDPGTHAGEALGAALTMDPESGDPKAAAEDRKLLLSALADADFISFDEDTISPADSLVIITGDSDGLAKKDDSESDTPTSSFAAQTLAKFAAALDRADGAVVLAGRVHTAADTGVIGLLRKDTEAQGLSTVDSLSREWARLATVLAVKEQLKGGHGAYGAASSAEAVAPAPDGATPSVPAEEQPSAEQNAPEHNPAEENTAEQNTADQSGSEQES